MRKPPAVWVESKLEEARDPERSSYLSSPRHVERVNGRNVRGNLITQCGPVLKHQNF